MHLNIFILVWRRKLTVLLVSSSLVLLTLWLCAFFDTNISYPEDGHAPNQDLNRVDSSQGHAYILQKLISQANRVLRHQRQQDLKDQQQSRLRHGGDGLIVPAAAHNTNSKSSGLVRFVKPTKKPPLAIVGAFEDERLHILESQQRVRNAVFEDFNNKNMDYERMMMTSAERQTQYEHDLQRMGVPVIPGIGPDHHNTAPNERLVHLDLKGAPPKLSFIKRLLPMLKSLGATGLLIEYEDMFPYTGALQPLAAKNAYKIDELKDFLESAALHGLSIMPLIQTFGHMEYALKLEEFEHMREIPQSPQSICPSQQDSLMFIQNMLTQVIEFHLYMAGAGQANGTVAAASGLAPEIPIKFTHIHIGCDEVFRMGECEKCRQHARNEIFLSHVTTVANFVRTRWPQLHVVIWDDMLRAMMLSEMQNSHIGSYVEPMIWVYVSDIYHFIQPQLWDMYSKVFPTVWAASAFKGAFGESLMVPPLQRHLENNIRWLAVIAKEGGRFAKGIKGLALTGWQRYDHFAVLCELLPTGIPSLITALSTVSKGYFNVNPKENTILRVLECVFHPDSRRSGHPWIEFNPNSHHSQLFSLCTYPGSSVYKFAVRLAQKLMETQNYIDHVQDKSAWMSDYNVRHNYSSPVRVHSLAGNTPTHIHELTAMSREAYEIMYDIFDEHTIAEFVEQNIYPAVAKLNSHLERANILLQRRVWPQRPLPYAPELINLNLIPNQNDPAAAGPPHP